jgi:hypothetical protein
MAVVPSDSRRVTQTYSNVNLYGSYIALQILPREHRKLYVRPSADEGYERWTLVI